MHDIIHKNIHKHALHIDCYELVVYFNIDNFLLELVLIPCDDFFWEFLTDFTNSKL